LRAIVDRFGSLRIGIVGDVLCDVYLIGVTDRVSREAPIIIVRQRQQDVIPGGAGNVARNVASLGARVKLFGVVGEDGLGRLVKEVIAMEGVDVSSLTVDRSCSTITKTRVLAGAEHTVAQQVLRIDCEPDKPIPTKVSDRVLAAMRKADADIDAWMVSDYGYGLASPAVRKWLAETAKRKPVLADSRYDVLGFSGMTAVKPNQQEALAAAGLADARGDVDMVEVARRIHDKVACGAVIMTMGNQGMLVYRGGDDAEVVPAVGTDEIVDLTGAGDTAGATLILALAAGASETSACMLANCAGSVVVMKQGCACCSVEELHATIEKACGR
jgi:rfaE bifunctional protein kinase chain/domain